MKQEGLTLIEKQAQVLKLLSEGRNLFVWFSTWYGKSFAISTAALLQASKYSTNPASPCRQVCCCCKISLLVFFDSYPRPDTINTRPSWQPSVILETTRLGKRLQFYPIISALFVSVTLKTNCDGNDVLHIEFPDKNRVGGDQYLPQSTKLILRRQ